MHERLSTLLFLCLLPILGLPSGCAYAVKSRTAHLTFAAPAGSPQRMPKKVVLVLAEDFTAYDRRIPGPDLPFELHFGPALEAYAKHTADAFFESVEVVHGRDSVPTRGADFILTPAVQKSDVVPLVVVTILEKRRLTLAVEWTLKRNGDSPALWMANVEGNGEGLSGAPELIERTVGDLWEQTVPAFKKMQTLERLR
jgi:hypothetical protein